MQFLLGYAVPNFYFHVTTAYNILRHNGIEIGSAITWAILRHVDVDYCGMPEAPCSPRERPPRPHWP